MVFEETSYQASCSVGTGQPSGGGLCSLESRPVCLALLLGQAAQCDPHVSLKDGSSQGEQR